MTSSLTYEDRLTFALGRWRGGDKTIRQLRVLASLLGSSQTLETAPSMGLASEVTVTRAWLAILRSYSTSDTIAGVVERYLVAGLLQNDRWRSMLNSEHEAREWVCLVDRFLTRGSAPERDPKSASTDLYRAVEGALYAALHDWIGSAWTAAGSYDDRVFAGTLFGQAWCAIMFDYRPQHTILADLIVATSPPFMPGSLPMEVGQSTGARDVAP